MSQSYGIVFGSASHCAASVVARFLFMPPPAASPLFQSAPTLRYHEQYAEEFLASPGFERPVQRPTRKDCVLCQLGTI